MLAGAELDQIPALKRRTIAYLPQGVYGSRLLFCVSARTNKRHHHHRSVGKCDFRCCDDLAPEGNIDAADYSSALPGICCHGERRGHHKHSGLGSCSRWLRRAEPGGGVNEPDSISYSKHSLMVACTVSWCLAAVITAAEGVGTG